MMMMMTEPKPQFHPNRYPFLRIVDAYYAARSLGAGVLASSLLALAELVF